MVGDAQRDCPTGCGRTQQPGKLLCSRCWGQVPRHLQRDVYRTWRAWRRDIGDGTALRDYRAARNAAIASVP